MVAAWLPGRQSTIAVSLGVTFHCVCLSTSGLTVRKDSAVVAIEKAWATGKIYRHLLFTTLIHKPQVTRATVANSGLVASPSTVLTAALVKTSSCDAFGWNT